MICSGSLILLSDENRKDVFCMLDDASLDVFENEKMEVKCFNIELNEETRVSITNDELDNDLFKFVITDSNGNAYTLATKSEESRIQWLNSILLPSCNKQQTTKLDDFEIKAVLGRGFYGKVMLAQHKETGRYVAIKSIRKKELIEKNKINTVLTERDILLNSHCPYIIEILSTFQTPSKFYLVLEYAQGGDLFTHLKNQGTLPYDEVKMYVAEIAIALNHLHEHSVIYRDLKPENVMFCSDGNIKLTDFGISKILKDTSETANTICGTDEYVPPEEIEHQPYGFAADWWQLGILMYEMIVGYTPFANDNKMTLYRNITKKMPSLFRIKDQGAKELIGMLLKKDPSQRAGFNEIKNSQFFKDFDWKSAEEKSLSPLFIPSSSSEDDLSNFDAEYTHQNIKESLVMPVLDNFEGFAYTSPLFLHE